MQTRKPKFLYTPAPFSFSRTTLYLLVLLIPMLLTLIQTSPPNDFSATAYLLLINSITFLLYLRDKSQSRIAGWRVTEDRLHFFELLGGWPAAFVAQRYLRHKTRKVTYQVVFWCIIILHETVLIEGLSGGFGRKRLFGTG